jgi:tetraacyldisaccharide 4'-kinase
VAEDRFVAGALAEHHLDATVHLLDDGFQHLELARDFDVVVTTPGEIAQGRVLPLGRLREPAETVQRADLLLGMGADATAAAAEAAALGVREAGGVIRRVGPPQPVPGSASQPEPGAPLLVAGIANPDRFAENVRAAGWAVAGEAWFPDHHPFTAQDIARIDQQRRASGAGAVFTTAKDAVRFEALGTRPFALYEVALAIEFDPPSLLFERVAQVISTRRRLEADLARVEVYGRLEPSPAHTPHAASRGDA